MPTLTIRNVPSRTAKSLKALARRYGLRGASEDAGQQRVHCPTDVVGDMGDQPHVACCASVERLAGEKRRRQLAPPAPRQDWHADDGGRDADANLGECEGDGAVDHDEIAGCHQTDTASPDGPVDGSDRWGGESAQPLEDIRHRVPRGLRILATGGTFLEVGARTEHRPGVSENDTSNVGLSGKVEGLVEFCEEPARQRVAICR